MTLHNIGYQLRLLMENPWNQALDPSSKLMRSHVSENQVSKTDQNSKQQATNISQTAMASQCIPTGTRGYWNCGRLTLAANAKAYSATTVFPAEVWAATNTDSFLSKWYIAYTQNIETPISAPLKEQWEINCSWSPHRLLWNTTWS